MFFITIKKTIKHVSSSLHKAKKVMMLLLSITSKLLKTLSINFGICDIQSILTIKYVLHPVDFLVLQILGICDIQSPVIKQKSLKIKCALYPSRWNTNCSSLLPFSDGLPNR